MDLTLRQIPCAATLRLTWGVVVAAPVAVVARAAGGAAATATAITVAAWRSGLSA
jgi:hypothetical protein